MRIPKIVAVFILAACLSTFFIWSSGYNFDHRGADTASWLFLIFSVSSYASWTVWFFSEE